MPIDTRPEDKPAAVRFKVAQRDSVLEVTVAALPNQEHLAYRIESGTAQFRDREAFKAKVVAVGMTPAVAEDPGRSFNATGRQLRELGFSVEVEEEQKEELAA